MRCDGVLSLRRMGWCNFPSRPNVIDSGRAWRARRPGDVELGTEDLEDYESDVELALYREYRDVCPMFRYWIETERRSYLANEVDVRPRVEGGRSWFDVELRDAWVFDGFRTNRFLSSVRVFAFKDVVIEELPREEAP